jgi:GntR family transcriptional repressor for pyruvate dehydrogenase complex
MQTPSRSAAIAAELRDDILRGQYRRGERLPSERDLAERFSVHRSAVREALKSLEQLGLADIRPGGARVAPIEEASLDVVEHLLRLEEPPDPAIVDQVLEVMCGLFSMAARLCAERANDEQREAIHALLAEIARPEFDAYERIQLVHQLGDVFVEASGNMVLKLVRRGVRTQFIEQMEENRPQVLAPLLLGEPHLESLGKAIEAADGAAAAEAIHELSLAIRRHALETILNERELLGVRRKSS